MRNTDESSGLLPAVEPDEPSAVSALPPEPSSSGVAPPPPFAGARGDPVPGGGGPISPPPPFAGAGAPPAGREGAGAVSPEFVGAGAVESDDPTAALAARLSEVTAGGEPSLVDLGGAPPSEPSEPARGDRPAPRVEAETRAAAAADDGALELDYERAGIAPGTRGHAAPEAERPAPSSAAPPSSPAASQAAVSQAAMSRSGIRSPDVSRAPDSFWHALVGDRLSRALAALALGIVVALPVAWEASRRAGRDQLEPLLEELETSAARPLAARAGTVRSLPEIRRDLDRAAGRVRTRYTGVLLAVGLLFGGVVYVGLGRLASRG